MLICTFNFLKSKLCIYLNLRNMSEKFFSHSAHEFPDVAMQKVLKCDNLKNLFLESLNLKE